MKIKNSIVFISCMFLLIISCFAGKPIKNSKPYVVVIDAGHGGHDAGAVGSKSKEKDITLALALKLGKLIQSYFNDVKVIYTRDSDEFVELYQRAKIANENHANLFICIHINSSENKQPYGFETFVMGLKKSQANLAVAKKENAAILLEKDYKNNYDGFDPNSPEANIIFSLYQNAYLDLSLDFSARIQKQFMKRVSSKDRGVSQAGFLVLYKTAMPAVLIEAGFISNQKEEEFLISENGKNTIAKSIFEAFREYKFKLEGINNQSQVYAQKDENESKTDENLNPDVKTVNTDSINYNKTDISFRVQFATSSNEKNISEKDVDNIGIVKMYYHNGLYKYTVGNEKNLSDANKLLISIQDKGFKDAFVVAFLNNERISAAEAVKILKSKQ